MFFSLLSNQIIKHKTYFSYDAKLSDVRPLKHVGHCYIYFLNFYPFYESKGELIRVAFQRFYSLGSPHLKY
jgi:hypothetical protein